MYTKICNNCQEEFECGRNGRRRKYCHSCSDQLKFKEHTKTCVECEIEFKISTPSETIRKFCSHSCSAKHSNKNRTKEKICINCKSIIKTRNANKFCSQSCSTSYRKHVNDQEVLNGNATSKRAKKYLIEQYGNICLNSDCAWDFNKKPIDVELEHIDGNSSNNNLDNLTLLCPNCHSLTPTYKAKNKGNGRAKRMERYYSGKSY